MIDVATEQLVYDMLATHERFAKIMAASGLSWDQVNYRAVLNEKKTCDFAPAVAVATVAIKAKWGPKVKNRRRVTKPGAVGIVLVNVPKKLFWIVEDGDLVN